MRAKAVPGCFFTTWLPSHYAAHTYSSWPHSDPKLPCHSPTISLVLFLMVLF